MSSLRINALGVYVKSWRINAKRTEKNTTNTWILTPPPPFFWCFVFFPLSKQKTHWFPLLRPYFRGGCRLGGVGWLAISPQGFHHQPARTYKRSHPRRQGWTIDERGKKRYKKCHEFKVVIKLKGFSKIGDFFWVSYPKKLWGTLRNHRVEWQLLVTVVEGLSLLGGIQPLVIWGYH